MQATISTPLPLCPLARRSGRGGRARSVCRGTWCRGGSFLDRQQPECGWAGRRRGQLHCAPRGRRQRHGGRRRRRLQRWPPERQIWPLGQEPQSGGCQPLQPRSTGQPHGLRGTDALQRPHLLGAPAQQGPPQGGPAAQRREPPRQGPPAQRRPVQVGARPHPLPAFPRWGTGAPTGGSGPDSRSGTGFPVPRFCPLPCRGIPRNAWLLRAWTRFAAHSMNGHSCLTDP